MYPRTLLSRSWILLAVVILTHVVPHPVLAQRLEDGRVAFENKARETRQLRVDLFKGSEPADPSNKRHQEAVDIAAKEVTYPLRWETLGLQPPEPGKLNRLVEDFEGRLFNMTKSRANTIQMQQMYCRQVIKRTQEVILNSKPIAGINAARILSKIPERGMERGFPQSEKMWLEEVQPRLAEGNSEYFAGVLLSLLDDPKLNDGIRYYLLRTLSNLLALRRQAPALLKKETAEKAIQVGIKLVEKKVVFPKAALRGKTEQEMVAHREVEGYKILRREAVKVVAQSQLPTFGEKDRPALTLARVVGNDGSIVPSPRLDERIEAAIGLAKMSANLSKSPDYQPDYVAFQIALFVQDFGLQAKENIYAKVFVRVRPWKVDAAHMIEALDDLKRDVKIEYVQKVVDQCLAVLRQIENGEVGSANALGDWLAKNPPTSKGVFRSGADSTIKPAAADPNAPPVQDKDKDKEEKDK